MRDIIHTDEVMESITNVAEKHVTTTGTTEGLPVAGHYARDFFESGGNDELDTETFDKGLAIAQILGQEVMTAIFASAVATEMEFEREGGPSEVEDAFVTGVKVAMHTYADLFSGGLAYALQSVTPAAPSYDDFIQGLVDGRFDELVASL